MKMPAGPFGVIEPDHPKLFNTKFDEPSCGRGAGRPRQFEALA